MAKKTSEFVSAIGVVVSIIAALVAVVKKHGGSDEDIHRLATPEGESLMDQIGRLIAEAGKRARNVFHLVVDYDQPVAEAIVQGKYDWVNDNIVQKNFPTVRNGKAEVAVELLDFGRPISTDEALRELGRMGYRPAELHELLALGRDCPALQREFPIVALGSSWRGGGDVRVPALWGSVVERSLNLRWVEDEWRGSHRFAAVRK